MSPFWKADSRPALIDWLEWIDPANSAAITHDEWKAYCAGLCVAGAETGNTPARPHHAIGCSDRAGSSFLHEGN